MAKDGSGLSNGLLNLAVVVFGLFVGVLLYAFFSHHFFGAADPVREENPAELVGDIIQVEVRNGCGVSGLAAETTHFLRGRGFDVVEVGDHSSFDLERSVVVDRVGNAAAARKVALALGLSEDRVIEEIRLDYYLDASVLIGKDYATLKPFAEAEEGQE